LGSKQFRTNQDKLDRTSTLHDRKRQRVHDAVAERKKGYHSDTSDEQSDAEDDAKMLPEEDDAAPLAGPSKAPSQSTQNDKDKMMDAISAPNGAGLESTSTSAVGSGLKGGIVPIVVKRNRKPVERVSFHLLR
jgi:hypothetical protein